MNPHTKIEVTQFGFTLLCYVCIWDVRYFLSPDQADSVPNGR